MITERPESASEAIPLPKLFEYAPADLSQGFWAVLAGLRFVLAAIVVLYHVGIMAPIPAWALRLFPASGPAAVVAFFIVSGISIAHSIRTRPAGFLMRRCDRILPVFFAAYVLSIVPFLIYGPAITEPHFGLVEAPMSILDFILGAALLNGIAVNTISTNGPLWSLAAEFSIYLCAPLFRKMSIKVLGGIACMSVLAWAIFPHFGNMRFDLMAGEYLCYWLIGWIFYCHHTHLWAKALLLIGPVLIANFAPVATLDGNPFGVIAISSSVILIASELRNRIRLEKVLNYIGDLSYPLYVFHFPILILLFANNHHRPLAVTLGACLLAGVIGLHMVDYPYRAYVHRRKQGMPRFSWAKSG